MNDLALEIQRIVRHQRPDCNPPIPTRVARSEDSTGAWWNIHAENWNITLCTCCGVNTLGDEEKRWLDLAAEASGEA